MKFAKILIAALAVAMVGCNNTDDNYTPTPELIKVCVDAGTSADTSADTRTEFNGTETTWAAGDQIRVAAFDVTNDAYLTEAVLTTQSTAIAGTFTGEVTEAQYEKIPRGSTYNYVAAYPSSAVIARDGKSVSFAVPATYTATPNSLNGHLFDFMVAAASDCASIAVTNPTNEYPTFGFEHVLGFFEISLAAEKPIKKVKISTPEGINIAGTVAVSDFENLTPAEVTNGSTVIEFTLGSSAQEGDKLYVPFIPFTLNGDIVVILTDETGNTHEIVKTVNREFKRGTVVKIGKVGFHEISITDRQTYVLKNNAGNFHSNPYGAQFVAKTNFDVEAVTFYAGSQDKSDKTPLTDATYYKTTKSGRTYTLNVDLSSASMTYEGYVWAETTINGKVHSTEPVDVLIPGNVSVSVSAQTSYSWYENDDVATANAKDRLTIYDPKADVTISNANYVKTLTLSQSGPASDKISGEKVKSVAFGDKNSQALGSYTYNASAVVGERTFSNAKTVYVTGLPYSVDCKNVGYSDAGWTTTGTVENFDKFGWQTRKYYWLSKWTNTQLTGSLFSPTFYTPAETNVTYTANMGYFTLGSVDGSATVYSGITTGTTIVTNSKTTTVDQTHRADKQYTGCTDNVSIPAGAGYRIYVGDNQPERKNVAENWVVMGSFSIYYR